MIIGIAGGSGSGKSTFTNRLVEQIRPIQVHSISTDRFFKSELPKMISPSSGKEYDNWNSPDSIDFERLLETVQGHRSENMEQTVVIVEGLSVLYFPELRDMFDLSIFIELDSDERMYRRIKRNMRMWNISMEEVADYYLESAKFEEKKFFLPTKQYADFIINGSSDFRKQISVISSWIYYKLGIPM